jgi:hypothetical protein
VHQTKASRSARGSRVEKCTMLRQCVPDIDKRTRLGVEKCYMIRLREVYQDRLGRTEMHHVKATCTRRKKLYQGMA